MTDAYILRGATNSQVERAVRAQGDLWQTHFREYREVDDEEAECGQHYEASPIRRGGSK